MWAFMYLENLAADQHAGHNRLIGKVSPKKGFVDGDVLDRHHFLAGNEFQDSID